VPNLSARVRARIEEVRDGRRPDLDLSGENLEHFPEEILGLEWLVTVGLRRNRITSVPAGVSNLRRLKRLDLQGNPIEAVPDVPGLILDWHSFLRCRPTLSPGNVVGITVALGDDQKQAIEVQEQNHLLRYLSKLHNLRELSVGYSAVFNAEPIYVPLGGLRTSCKGLGIWASSVRLTFLG
jgi:Leucine-rich repeat (LRR) protein